MNKSIIIFGTGSFAQLMHYYFAVDSVYSVSAFTVDLAYVTSPSFCGLPVVPFERLRDYYPPTGFAMFAAVGYRGMRARQAVFERAKSAGYHMISYVSSRSLYFGDITIGQNNVVMGHVQIEPFTTIGENNVFWSGTLIAHGVSIGNGNYFGARCVVGGNSTIENSCFLGNGTVTINEIALRNETHTLPGTVLLRSTKPFCKYVGNPGREIGTHKEKGIIIERG